MLGAARRARAHRLAADAVALRAEAALADAAELLFSPGLGLSRTMLVLQLSLPTKPSCAELRAAAQLCFAVLWPERRLHWHLPQEDDPPVPLLRCSLLAVGGGDDPGAEAALLRRLERAGCASVRVLAATLLPLPLLAPPPAGGAGSLEGQLAALRLRGLVAMPPHAGLSTEQLSWLNVRCYGSVSALGAADRPPPAVQELARARLGTVEVRLAQLALCAFEDECAFAEVASRGRGRLELRLPLPAPGCAGGGGDGARLLALAAGGPWAALARAVLRCDAPLVTASVVLSRPGATRQPWHADGPHDGRSSHTAAADAWAAALAEAPAALPSPNPVPPRALCIFFALRDLTAALGGTAFWSGSHVCPGFVEAACSVSGTSLLSSAALTHTPMLRAGCALAYDYRLVHAGEANCWNEQQVRPGDDGLRPLLQFVFRCSGEAGSSGWAERSNFGEAQLLPVPTIGREGALAGSGSFERDAWAAELPADAAAAAAGKRWWAAAYRDKHGEAESGDAAAAPPPPPPPPPHAAGWDVFD